jgi:pSer/pThr/pTyr-binding forkhead associated (FHA) protein
VEDIAVTLTPKFSMTLSVINQNHPHLNSVNGTYVNQQRILDKVQAY